MRKEHFEICIKINEKLIFFRKLTIVKDLASLDTKERKKFSIPLPPGIEPSS